MDWASYPAFGDRVLSMVGIEVHWIILQLVLGLPLMAVIAEILWLKTRDERWLRIAKTLAKGFVMVFAVGAAMGTAAEFGLILLWPNLTELAGKYIFFPLYAEIFAFMMEVVFVYMFYYAWDKLPEKVHVLVGILAIIGAWFSATMIMSVNAYMQAPTGILLGSYADHFPKLILYVPNGIVAVLNVTSLKAAGMDVLGKYDGGVIVAMPSEIVRAVVSDAISGKTLHQSILWRFVTDESLANVSVMSILDSIMRETVRHEGVTTITFKSPVFIPSVLHAIGSGLVVSAFTAMAFYGYSARRRGRDVAKLGFKYALLFSLVSLAFQGMVSGHEMGVAVAEWNKEKFSAILYGSPPIVEKIETTLAGVDAIGYDEIPKWLRPPTLIHWLYYAKITLAVLLGLSTVILAYLTFVKKREVFGSYLLVFPVVAQVVSFLGWAVREIGRKPWTIYGVMDVKTAHTINPPPPYVEVIVSVYFVAVLSVLIYGVYRFLWRCEEC